jgi:hypothetical protein
LAEGGPALHLLFAPKRLCIYKLSTINPQIKKSHLKKSELENSEGQEKIIIDA